ncbi:NB-ARC - like 10, partial [Theobroma cacao]
MLEKADRIAVQGCSSSCNILPRYQLSRRMAKKRLEVKHLIDTCNFDTVVTHKKSPVRAVEKQQGPSLAGQREAVEMIERLLKFLKGGENKRIAVWGMGGVGIKGLGFGKVPPDDVWERIDLDIVGVPQDDDQANCKILLTTRSLDVCRAMMTNEEIKLDVLNKAASWNLFAQNAGDAVEVPGINPLARAVARECSGLPLALETVGMSTRNRRKIELWKHALHHLQRSAPHVKCIEDEVYLPLMLRYNSLPRFHSLESLDLSFSAYKWDARCNIEDERAAFDEILTLEELSIVKIRLDKVDSLVLDAYWLRRLREFNIQIRPTSRYSNYLPTEHNEKRVILRGVGLMGRGLKGLLCSATALDLVICGGMSALSEQAINNSLSGLKSLKSLTISKCDCITSLISGENIVGSILPKLEHLSLSRLENLAAILGGMVPRRGCLKMVKNYRGLVARKRWLRNGAQQKSLVHS